MKIFIDANILVAVLNKEIPLFGYAARILSLPKPKFMLYTSSVCLAIAFYFTEKKHGTHLARTKISLLANHINITDCGYNEVNATVKNQKIHDFEDGLEYFAALNAGCKVIVTQNTEDFYFAEIEIVKAQEFLEKYAI